MTISKHLEEIKKDFDTIQSDLKIKDIDIAPGRFDASELGRDSFRAPALRIAFLGAPKTQAQADGSRKFDAAFAVFILTDGRGRALEGIDITEAVAERIEANRFSAVTDTGLPKNIRMDALYSTQIDKKGVSLYSVSWVQTLKIGKSCSIAGPTDDLAVVVEGTELDQEIDITKMPNDAVVP